MKRALLVLMAAAVAVPLIALPVPARADAGDITKQCKFAVSSNTGSAKRATDGKLTTVWKSAAKAGEYIEITLKTSAEAGGLYLRWDAPPRGWKLTGYNNDGAAATLDGGADGYLAEYVALPAEFAGCEKLRLSSGGAKGIAIVELSVYGPGDAPGYAPQWQQPDGPVDVMIVAAHPDDDVLYMGAVIPNSAPRGKTAVTLYMTYGKPLRRFEAMEGSWIEGERIQPVMGPFPDVYNSKNMGDMGPQKRSWPEAKALAFLVEQIRKYKPAVIVTHDTKGEYGHGAHKWTCELVQKAFEQAGDPALFPDTAQKYGAWTPAKLYLHLYNQNELTLDTKTKLPQYGNKTAFEIAKLAYTRHKSQMASTTFIVRDTRRNNIRSFGLAKTNVGPDKSHNDMFENIGDGVMAELNPQYNYATVDRAALADAITRAGALKAEDYTPESWEAAAIPAAITTASAVLDKKTATQSDVDGAAAALNGAATGLQPARRLTGITVTPPQKRLYLLGETLDLGGMDVTGSYSDGSTEAVPADGADVAGFDSTAPASGQTVTVTVDGQAASFTVDVVDLSGVVMQLLRWLGFAQ